MAEATTAGWQGSGVKIGAAEEAQGAQSRVCGDAEATDNANALGEGADNHIDIIFNAELFAQARPLIAIEAEGMGLIHHDHAAMALGGLDDGFQIARSPQTE